MARTVRTGSWAFIERREAGAVLFIDALPRDHRAFAYSVARGLSAHPRTLPTRYLYDEAGSQIFSRITEQPEYYLTRAETEILTHQADGLRAAAGSIPLVELGAGTATKTRLLLEAWRQAAGETATEYVPIDIDASVLVGAARRLTEAYPDLVITGLATSYERGLMAIRGDVPLCLVFLGSSIGNFDAAEMEVFLGRLSDSLSSQDAFLLGVDLVKDPEILEAAYNDAAGYSQAFTRNLFVRMNRELGCGIPVETIDHVAFWNDRLERIEIYARFREAVSIELESINRRFRVAPGEMVRTEISRKYRIDGIEADLARFGMRVEARCTDQLDRFAVLLCRPIERPAGPPPWTSHAARLQEVRGRTLELIDALSDEQLAMQVDTILSPIAWDLAHMAEFELQWLVRAVGKNGDAGRLPRIYDAILTPRSGRGELDFPSRETILNRLRRVRQAALERLRRVAAEEGDRLLQDGFVYHMIVQHEAQHQETILQSVALMDDFMYEPAYRHATPRVVLEPDTDMVIIPADPFPLGSDGDPRAYDNERPAHWVEIADFWIDSAPVTNGAFLDFIRSGGYQRPEIWRPEGWQWRVVNEIEWPAGWRKVDGGWQETRFGRVEPLVTTRPVQHVSWFEADAYATAAGLRLPTEAEWEKAAAWDPELRIARRWPWGDVPPDDSRANLGARLFAPAPVGTYPSGRSFFGCHQMIGDVWEWTASEFGPYPGFEPFPYPEYSAAHFGKGYRVLRGGSWATAAAVARNTFRNWDLPERRQIFAGFRCARDA